MAFNCSRLTHPLESRSTRFELGSSRLVACLPAEGASGADPSTRAHVSGGDVLNARSVFTFSGQRAPFTCAKYERYHCCTRTAFSCIALYSISIVLGTGDVLRVVCPRVCSTLAGVLTNRAEEKLDVPMSKPLSITLASLVKLVRSVGLGQTR